ncbi:hypothetical protein OH77DRAFT_1422470 [Trametes cingulata]|nr:hypothetical protein OH77DRAFT_1422470 [Trametes cingulata]
MMQGTGTGGNPVTQPQFRFVQQSGCIEDGCTAGGKLANSCSHRRCKKHCILQHTPCGCKAHDQARRALVTIPVPVLADPFRLAHPPPVIPPKYPVIEGSTLPAAGRPALPNVTQDPVAPTLCPGATTAAQQVAPRSFSKPMSQEWSAQWDNEACTLRERREAKVLVRKYQAVHDHSIILRIWKSAHEPPETYAVQGIATWPMFILSSQPDLLDMLSLGPTDLIERFDLSTRFWISEKVSTVVRIHQARAHVLYRLAGLKNCLDIDRICEEAVGMRGRPLLPAPAPVLGTQPCIMTSPGPALTVVPKYMPTAPLHPSSLHQMSLLAAPGVPGPSTFTIPETAAVPASGWLDPRLCPAAELVRPVPSRSSDSMMSLVTATSNMSIDSLDSQSSGMSAVSGKGHCVSSPSLALDVNTDLCGDNPQASDSAAPSGNPTPAHSPLGLTPSLDLSPSALFPPHIARFMPTIPPILNSTMPDDLDRLWARGVVYTPPLTRRPWPYGIFARDMGVAMLMLGDATAAVDDTLPARFMAIFQGRAFKNATYSAQRLAWFNSPEEQRQWILKQPRTKAGLWTECRRTLKGWQEQPDHKRH